MMIMHPWGSLMSRELNLVAYLSFICHPYLCFFSWSTRK